MHRGKLRGRVAGIALATAALVASVSGVSGTWAVESPGNGGSGQGPRAGTPTTGALFTTIDEAVDGGNFCHNGNPNVNCNLYDGKAYVWLSGGPEAAGLDSGEYVFTVLEPGGQNRLKNLQSVADYAPDTGDTILSTDDPACRRYGIDAGGTVTYPVAAFADACAVPHRFDQTANKVNLLPYDDTTNPGGVYILSACKVAVDDDPTNDYSFAPSQCKYDMFKVAKVHDTEGSTTTTSVAPIVYADPLTVVKDATADFTRTFGWGISKSVDKTVVKQVGAGSATFNYTVAVTHDAGTVSGVTVHGAITVANPNDAKVSEVTVSDQLSNGTTCAVDGGAAATLAAAGQSLTTTFPYSCSLDGLPVGPLSNTVTAAWGEQTLSDGSVLKAGTASFTFEDIAFTEHRVDDCAAVTDLVWAAGASVCSADASPATFAYARTVAVPTWDCVSYGNQATVAGIDTQHGGLASQSVTTCGPAKTGALTIGFWQNKNGQALVTGQAPKAALCPSTGYLRQYAPFKDLSATATCTQVASYVTTVIKLANASGAAMNAMLKAQMLSTSLDVQLAAPSLGGVSIDLTKLCKDIAACKVYESTSSVFGGAPSMTVAGLLAYAASQSNDGGSSWYANVKAVQELAKDTFDAINNERAFSA